MTRNASRRTVNVEPDLQRKSDDRYQCHQLSPGDSERLREARVRDHHGRVRSGMHFLTSSLGKPWKVLGTVWRPTPTILIVVTTLVFCPVSACVSRYLFSFMHSAQLMIDSRSRDTSLLAGSRFESTGKSFRVIRMFHSLMLSCVFWVARTLH